MSILVIAAWSIYDAAWSKAMGHKVMPNAELQNRIDAVRKALLAFASGFAQPNVARQLVAALVAHDLPSTELAKLIGQETCLWGSALREPATDILRAFMDIQRTKEHVAAQERMSAAAEELQKAALVLGRQSVEVGRQGVILSVATGFLALAAIVVGVLTLRH